MVKRILVIDDDEGDRKLIIEYLSVQDNDLEFEMAESGEKGVEIVKKSKPDLIVLDVNMPGIDGFETCKRIKAIDSNIKVLILTGFSESIDYAARELAGAEEYLTKDFMEYTLPKAFQKIDPQSSPKE